jgi:hypothetical protein
MEDPQGYAMPPAELVLSVASDGLSKARLIQIFESRCKPVEQAGPQESLS